MVWLLFCGNFRPLALPAGFVLLAAVSPAAAATPASASCADLLKAGFTASKAEDELKKALDAKDAQGVLCNIINTQAKNADLFSFDYGIPHSPALMLAGLSPDKVTPATSLKAFAMSLPGLAGSGSSVTSAALDAAPAWMLSEQEGMTAIDYAADANTLDRIWYRTRIGVAIAKGDDGGGDATKAKPSRAAFGVSFSLADGSDPIMARTASDLDGDKKSESHWVHCLRDHLDDIAPFVPSRGTGYLEFNDAKADIGKLLIRYVKVASLDDGSDDAGETKRLLGEVFGIANLYLKDSESLTVSSEWSDPDKRNKKLLELSSKMETKASAIRETPDWKASATSAAAAIQTCAKEANTISQHGADLQIGAGVVMQGPAGGDHWADFTDPNASVWIAGRLPLNIGQSGTCEPASGTHRSELACWTFGGSGRYSMGEQVATGNAGTPFFKADVAEGWIGLERTDSISKFGAYFGYLDQSAAEVAGKPFAKHGTRWLLSGAYNLASINDNFDGLWIVGSYGAANGSLTTLDDKVALLSLTFAPPKIGSGFINKDN